jgi:hypothetical protein
MQYLNVRLAKTRYKFQGATPHKTISDIFTAAETSNLIHSMEEVGT